MYLPDNHIEYISLVFIFSFLHLLLLLISTYICKKKKNIYDYAIYETTNL